MHTMKQIPFLSADTTVYAACVGARCDDVACDKCVVGRDACKAGNCKHLSVNGTCLANQRGDTCKVLLKDVLPQG